jgi:hypothetical protein
MAHNAVLPILTAEPGLTHYLEEIRRFPMLERQPDTDDMRSSRNRTFAFPASAAAARGQTRKDSKTESDRDIPSSALGCPPGALVSSFEFIDPARFYGQVMASGRRPASHAADRCPEDL